eukprot:4189159-Pyramimonas_sp.AAC.1
MSRKKIRKRCLYSCVYCNSVCSRFSLRLATAPWLAILGAGKWGGDIHTWKTHITHWLMASARLCLVDDLERVQRGSRGGLEETFAPGRRTSCTG